MRLPTVLSVRELPEQELISAALDGELQHVGDAYCPIDTVVDIPQRAAAVAAGAPEWAIADRHTAAWIFGAALDLPHPLHLCVDSRTRLHPISTRLIEFREVVIEDHDLMVIADMPVTSPLRTAIDLARVSADFSPVLARIIARLSVIGKFTFAECESAVNSRRNLPNKHRALQRLTNSFSGG